MKSRHPRYSPVGRGSSGYKWMAMVHKCLENLEDMYHSCTLLYEPCHEKTYLCQMRTTKAQPSSLISTFVVRCLDIIIPILAKSKISTLDEQTGLSLTWSKPPKIGFLMTRLNYTIHSVISFLFQSWAVYHPSICASIHPSLCFLWIKPFSRPISIILTWHFELNRFKKWFQITLV